MMYAPTDVARYAITLMVGIDQMLSRTHFAIALVMAVLFGAGWVFGKTATAHFPPVFVAALRFGFAGVILVSIHGWPKIRLGRLMVASACAVAVPYSLTYVGLSQLDVSMTVLLVQLEAPILIILSALLLKEKPDSATVIGVLLAVVGVVFVVGPPSVEGHYNGASIVLVSLFVWAIGQILIRQIGLEDGGLKLLGALATLAAPLLLFLSFMFETGQSSSVMTAPPLAWVQIGYLAIAMTVLGQGAWYYLVARHPLHIVAPFLLLVPVFSVVGGVVFLGEALPLGTLIGGLIIIGGVGVSMLPKENQI